MKMLRLQVHTTTEQSQTYMYTLKTEILPKSKQKSPFIKQWQLEGVCLVSKFFD